MSDAASDARKDASKEHVKNMPLDERIKKAKRECFYWIEVFLSSKESAKKCKEHKGLIRNYALRWDKLSGGGDGKKFLRSLNRLKRKDESAWVDLLCATADYMQIFFSLKDVSPFKGKAITIFSSNGDSIRLIRGHLKALIEDDLLPGTPALYRHLIVTPKMRDYRVLSPKA